MQTLLIFINKENIKDNKGAYSMDKSKEKCFK
jgi:hypothetical protein